MDAVLEEISHLDVFGVDKDLGEVRACRSLSRKLGSPGCLAKASPRRYDTKARRGRLINASAKNLGCQLIVAESDQNLMSPSETKVGFLTLSDLPTSYQLQALQQAPGATRTACSPKGDRQKRSRQCPRRFSCGVRLWLIPRRRLPRNASNSPSCPTAGTRPANALSPTEPA